MANLGCKCGLISVTPAGYKQMAEADRRRFEADVRSCKTCRLARDVVVLRGCENGKPTERIMKLSAFRGQLGIRRDG